MTADQAARRQQGHFSMRVLVSDASGVFRDVSTVAGFPALKSVRWEESIDTPGMTADFELWRNQDAISFSPLHTDSPLNRHVPFDATSPLGALVDLNRRVRIEWALQADAAQAPTWVRAFEGLIESVSLDARESVAVGVRGQYAELQDRLFEEEVVFAFAASAAAGAFRIWAPNTAYATGDRVIPTGGRANGRHYQVTTPGTSGASEPAWPVSGTVTDGTVVHTQQGLTSTTAGYAVQNVMTQMAQSVLPLALFGDLGGGVISVYTPVPPGWNINVFKVPREPVWDQLVKLAQQIGWDLRWKWSNPDAQFRLTLYDPNRAKTTPDFTFALADIREYASLDLDIANIRNVVRVLYSDSADRDPEGVARRKLVTVSDGVSVNRYGRRYMEVAESSSSAIDSSSEATTMANAMLSDLASPVAELEAKLRFFPWVELTDLLQFPADGRRFTSAQNLAVTSYVHDWSSGRGTTTVRVRGKPSSGWYRWARIGAPNNPQDNSLVTFQPPLVVSVGVESTPRGGSVAPNVTDYLGGGVVRYETHVSSVPAFTATKNTLKGARQTDQVTGLRPGDTYYTKVVPKVWDANGRVVEGRPSAEVSFTAGFVEGFDLNPETTDGARPANGSFESSIDGHSTPPAHWEMEAGAWGTDASKSVDARSGGISVEFFNTSGAWVLRSKWFPVQGGQEYLLQCALKRVGGVDGNVRLTVEWADPSKVSAGTATYDVNVSGYVSWGLVPGLVANCPTGASFARIKVGRASSGTWAFRVDDVTFARLGQPWEGLVFAANWADYGAGFMNGQYVRDWATGRVRLRGLVQTAIVRAANSVIATLPVGWRPTAQEVFAQATGGVGAFARVDVLANGNIQVGPALAANDWVSLSGIAFDAR